MGLFKAIHQKLRDKTADKWCNHLLALGIPAEILRGHPLQKVGASGAKSLGLVQVAGRNIGYVSVIRASEGFRESTHAEYYLKYLVPLGETPSSLCRAGLVTKKRGLLQREVVDIEWGGGTLADTLNGDQSLKQSLLMEFRLNGPLEIVIAPEPIYRCIVIETGLHLPSGNLFDCLDRIAKLATEHVTEVNSQPEQVLLEAKVELNPGSKDAEVASCSVTDRHLRIESREPLQIPLYMVENCWFRTPMPSFGGGMPVVSYSTFTLRYLDESGHGRKVEFEIQTGDAGSLADTIRHAYPRGITR